MPALGTEPPDPLHLDHIKASQRLKAVLTLKQLAGFHCAEDARKSKELHLRNPHDFDREAPVFVRETHDLH